MGSFCLTLECMYRFKYKVTIFNSLTFSLTIGELYLRLSVQKAYITAVLS